MRNDNFGNQVRLELLKCLIDDIDIQGSQKKATTNNVKEIKMTILSQEIVDMSSLQNFPSLICEALGVECMHAWNFMSQLFYSLGCKRHCAIGIFKCILPNFEITDFFATLDWFGSFSLSRRETVHGGYKISEA
jgi:hypothetical protein